MNCVSHGSYPNEGSCPVCDGLKPIIEWVLPIKTITREELEKLYPPRE